MRLWMRLVLIRYKISDFFSGLLAGCGKIVLSD